MLFNDVKSFMKKHGLTPDQLNVRDGFLIAPLSLSNQAGKKEKHGILLKTTFLDLYKIHFPDVVEAVLYQMKLNGIKFDPLNNVGFSTGLAMLAYMLAFFKRRMEMQNIPSIGYKWEDIKNFFNKAEVERMYAALELHLQRKGLTKKTAKEILYCCDETYHGIDNILEILNTLEKIYHPDTRNTRKLLRKRLIGDIRRFGQRNPLSEQIGKVMEKVVWKESGHIKKYLLEVFQATKAKMFKFDTDPVIKRTLKSTKKIKVPDFLYLDNSGNLLALDSKFSLEFARTEQISAAQFKRTLAAVYFFKKTS